MEFRPRTPTVLLVEDSPTTQRVQTAAVEAAGRFRAIGATNGQEALDILRREVVDVVVTDLQMPVMDGFQLIAEVSTRYPGLPIFVLSANPDPLRRDPTLSSGCLHIHSKPPDFELLARQIYAVRSLPLNLTRGVPLPSLLQLLQWEGRTATVTVHSGELLGRLYIQNGHLVQAEIPDQDGLEAAYTICAWPEPSVEFVDACRVAPVFRLSAEELQMELAMRRDERHA